MTSRVYAGSKAKLLQLLDLVLTRCEAYELAPHAKKCESFVIDAVRWFPLPAYATTLTA